MKNFINKVKRFFVGLYCKAALYLSAKYNVVYEIVTLKLLAQTSKMVRRLIVLKGKDPDYVPPPPPAPPKELIWSNTVPDRARPNTNFVFQSAPWVKNMGDHPILRSRAQFEENQRKSKTKRDLIVDDVKELFITNPEAVQDLLAFNFEVEIPDNVEEKAELEVLKTATVADGSDHEESN